MPKFVITIEDRYEVEADSAEQALASYRVIFEGVKPQAVGLLSDEVIPESAFDYLDGSGKVEEA